MRIRSALIVGMAGTVLALSGCGGDDDTPATLPSATDGASESGSATDSATPSATPTADPTAALQAELEAFFRDYTSAINESFTSEEAAERRRGFYSTSCSVCVSGQRLVDGWLEQGQVLRGGTGELVRLQIDSVEPDQVVVQTVSSLRAGDVVQGDTVVETFPANPDLTVVYTVNRQPSGQWLIIQGEKLG